MLKAIVHLVALVLAVLAGVLLTFFLWPFWDRFEQLTGIESLGHSGPADWCYVIVCSVCALAGAILARRTLRSMRW